MEDNKILDAVNRAIAVYLDPSDAALGSDVCLKEEHGLDSTEMVFVAVDIEKALGVSLKGMKFGALKTRKELASAIEARLQGTENRATV